MKKNITIVLVLDCLLGIISFLRICIGKGTVYDYIVLFFTIDLLVLAMYKKNKEQKKQEDAAQNGNSSADGSVS